MEKHLSSQFSVETVLGCTDEEACNFDFSANTDDGSCTYADENFDCDGNCTVDVDCFGQCGGDAVEDCSGECGGTAVEDACGVCDEMALHVNMDALMELRFVFLLMALT